MYSLSNKTILLISPQSWGKMFVSKHHYALELAKKGNLVYFLNPPGEKVAGSKDNICIEVSGIHENLFLVNHHLSFPYNIKFHFIGLFHLLMQPHVKKILKKIGIRPDIVWSFDLGNLYPFSFFPKESLKVFHPVDEPLNSTAINSARGAELMFSVTPEILDKYKGYPIPQHLINHGISEEFLQADPAHKNNNKIHVGFAGNLLRPDIDRRILLQIINENPEIIFECWGSYQVSEANLSGSVDENTKQFIYGLQQSPNVKLHGTVSSPQLAKELQRMNAFLICYDVQKDQSKGTNYHKVMEYISSGKVIIANNITGYKTEPVLVQMVEERDHNNILPALFKKIVGSLDNYNAAPLQEQRKKYATENTYGKQIERIEQILKTAGYN